MDKMKQNYYGSLCTELYEILHKEAPRDELDFYLSYAEKDKKILEVMCGRSWIGALISVGSICRPICWNG